MTAFVLGNGRSRADIDIDRLMLLGSVYGCNALYRTHRPTVLVATDRTISAEIQESGYALQNRFYTRRPIDNLGAQRVPKEYFGFSSGPIAMSIAAEDGNDPIYLVGFDMGPSETGRLNNIYADTPHYRKADSSPIYPGNWIKQMVKVAQDHKTQRFIRVHANLTADIPEFATVPNMEKIEIFAFMDLINTSKDL